MRVQLTEVGEALDGDAKFKLDHLSELLDLLVAMRWDLGPRSDRADLPKTLTDQLQMVDHNLQAAILTLKMLVHYRESRLTAEQTASGTVT